MNAWVYRKMNYKILALAISGTLLLNGCASIKDASTALGSIGTGVFAGVAAGAGTGILCDKLTGGRSTELCIAAGMAVGTLVGTWAASLDEAAEKAVPAMDCKSVKRRMNYSSTKPKALLKFEKTPLSVIKPGESFTLPIKMDLVTPGSEGEESTLPFKIEIMANGEKSTGKVITKECGGDYSLPVSIQAEKEDVYNTTIKLIDPNTSNPIDGGVLTFCYTVAKDGVDKCHINLPSITSDNTSDSNTKNSGKKVKSKKKK